MQSVSSRICVTIAVSISYDDNHYTTGTSIYIYVCVCVCACVWRCLWCNGYRRRKCIYIYIYNFFTDKKFIMLSLLRGYLASTIFCLLHRDWNRDKGLKENNQPCDSNKGLSSELLDGHWLQQKKPKEGRRVYRYETKPRRAAWNL